MYLCRAPFPWWATPAAHAESVLAAGIVRGDVPASVPTAASAAGWAAARDEDAAGSAAVTAEPARWEHTDRYLIRYHCDWGLGLNMLNFVISISNFFCVNHKVSCFWFHLWKDNFLVSWPMIGWFAWPIRAHYLFCPELMSALLLSQAHTSAPPPSLPSTSTPTRNPPRCGAAVTLNLTSSP